MTPKQQALRTFLIEDWRPVAPELGGLLAELGHEPDSLPNVLDTVRKRIHRDRPPLVIVNATSLLIGEPGEWRYLLGTDCASLVIVPPAATASFFERARAVGFRAMVDPPLIAEKLALAIDMALRSASAARRLRLEIRRLHDLQERLQLKAQPPAGNGNGHDAQPPAGNGNGRDAALTSSR